MNIMHFFILTHRQNCSQQYSWERLCVVQIIKGNLAVHLSSHRSFKYLLSSYESASESMRIKGPYLMTSKGN